MQTLSVIDVESVIAEADSSRETAMNTLQLFVSNKSIPCSERFVVFSDAPGWLKRVVSRESLSGIAYEVLPAGIPVDLDHLSVLFDSIQTDDLLTELCESIMDNMIGLVIE